jgi:hypothetical protein
MKRILLITGAALALAACGSTASKATTKTTSTKTTQAPAAKKTAAMTKATAAATFSKDVAPMDAALLTFVSVAKTWTNATPQSTVSAAINPTVAALNPGETKLNELATQYPAAAANLHALTGAAGSLGATLLSATQQNPFNLSSWFIQLAQADATLGKDASIVRSQLGIPSANS